MTATLKQKYQAAGKPKPEISKYAAKKRARAKQNHHPKRKPTCNFTLITRAYQGGSTIPKAGKYNLPPAPQESENKFCLLIADFNQATQTWRLRRLIDDQGQYEEQNIKLPDNPNAETLYTAMQYWTLQAEKIAGKQSHRNGIRIETLSPEKTTEHVGKNKRTPKRLEQWPQPQKHVHRDLTP